MITVKEDTTFIGVSELRTEIDKILEQSKKHKVLIGRRNKPVAVLINIEKFEHMELILDTLEDMALGYLAKEREAKSKSSDFVPIARAYEKISPRKKCPPRKKKY